MLFFKKKTSNCTQRGKLQHCISRARKQACNSSNARDRIRLPAVESTLQVPWTKCTSGPQHIQNLPPSSSNLDGLTQQRVQRTTERRWPTEDKFLTWKWLTASLSSLHHSLHQLNAQKFILFYIFGGMKISGHWKLHLPNFWCIHY